MIKVYKTVYTHKWSFHWIPSIQLYSESHSLTPQSMNGLYFSIQFAKWEFVIGFYNK
jgi:hypothetical protein